MDWDHLAEEQSLRFFAGWLRILSSKCPELPLLLANHHFPGSCATEATGLITGSYNMCSTVTFQHGPPVIVRFPIFGRSRFRIEKSTNEVVTLGFLRRRTQVPVPLILGMGSWGLGPYLVMSVVEGSLLSKCVKGPADQSNKFHSNISDFNLKRAYHEMAQVLIELSKPIFPTIGALERASGEWSATKRPLTLNMNELVRVGNFPPSKLTNCTFQTSSEYFQELANQQFLHLKYQRNDAVSDMQDCQKKFVARCLFRKIAGQIPTDPGPFHLYCDDLRPSNVLVSESDLSINGVIDWEFTYAAPIEFATAAPWWLLFESPEAWESDLNKFLVRYTPCLQLFLEVLRAREDDQIQKGTLTESQRLSNRMARSMENGMFWFCLAARKSYMFDDIYWAFIDEKHFGSFGSLDDRISLLSMEERNELDDFVKVKMREAGEKTLDEHLTHDEIVEL